MAHVVLSQIQQTLEVVGVRIVHRLGLRAQLDLKAEIGLVWPVGVQQLLELVVDRGVGTLQGNVDDRSCPLQLAPVLRVRVRQRMAQLGKRSIPTA